jgi:hypothetical protein
VFVIALGTYAVVDIRIHLIVELQCEHIEGGKSVVLLAPSVTPRTTAIDGALFVGRWHVVTNSHQTTLAAEVEDG